MERPLESSPDIDKQAEFQKESEKLNALFADVDENKKKLAAGLIEDAAYLYAENKYLRHILSQTGMVRINPNNSQQQRPIEAAKQYRSNVDTYSSLIGRLSRIIDAQDTEEDDDMEEYSK
jgi:regulator of replication initiation timing